MKHILLSLLIPSGIIIAMEGQISLDFLNVSRDGDKITASAWVYEKDGFYFVKKNTTENTFSMDRMVPVDDATRETEEPLYQPVTDEPEIFALLAQKISVFEKPQVNNSQNLRARPVLRKKYSFRLFGKK